MNGISSYKRVQRAALALNNEAVSLLLPQGNFEQAKKALSSSLEMLETLLLGCFEEELEGGTNGGGSESLSGEGSSDHDNKLLLLRSLEHSCRHHHRVQSARHLNRSDDPQVEVTRGVNNHNNMNRSFNMLPFDIHILEDNDFGSMRSAIRYGCSSSVFFPLVLRDEFLSNEGSHLPLDLLTLSRQYAVILYNTAITYIMHGEYNHFQMRQQLRLQGLQEAHPPQPSLEAKKIAQRLLSCSDSVLSSVVTETSKHEFRNAINAISRIQLLLVAGLVLNQFAFVLLQSKQHEDQGKFALQSVENLVGVLDQYPVMFTPALMSSAA